MDEPREKLPVTLTRDQLYALVWETPMFRLAPRYGLTGNGLKKICKRLQVRSDLRMSGLVEIFRNRGVRSSDATERLNASSSCAAAPRGVAHQPE